MEREMFSIYTRDHPCHDGWLRHVWQRRFGLRKLTRKQKNWAHLALCGAILLGIVSDPHAGVADWGFWLLAVHIELL